MAQNKLKVLVVDDSAFMRKKISDILSSDPDIGEIKTAKNGKRAIEELYAFSPDVITLDVEMPILNGLETLGYIMSEKPVPCVMISAFTTEGAKETIKALEFGAVDFVTKPDHKAISSKMDSVANEIINKVKLAATVPVSKLKLIFPQKAHDKKSIIDTQSTMSKILVIASSTGGTQALASVLPQLSQDIQAAILVVQHMPAGFTKGLAERLNWQSQIEVVEAEDGMAISPGKVIIAKGGFHMVVSGSVERPIVKLDDGAPQGGLKPCADILMESVADLFQKKVVGIVLTGMGSDGTKGARAIKEKGGSVFAENQSSCVIYGMPKSIIEAGLADDVCTLLDMPKKIEAILRE